VEAYGVEAQNTFAMAVAGRGFDARISTEFAVPLTDSACVYCGNCIGVCPSALARGAPREYETITTTKEDIIWHSMLSILLQARPSKRTTR
jgi:predicted molibdopterin-dependent oxidoreductase YjgC